MKIYIDRVFVPEKERLNRKQFEYKVQLKESNGRIMLQSLAWSPRKVDARRIARKIQAKTNLQIIDRL